MFYEHAKKISVGEVIGVNQDGVSNRGLAGG